MTVFWLFQQFVLLFQTLNLLFNHRFIDLKPSNLIKKEILPIKTVSLFRYIDGAEQPDVIFLESFYTQQG